MGWMANKIKSKCLIPLQKDWIAATIAAPLLVAHHIHQAWTWPYNAILCCKLKMLPAPKISPHYMVGLITMCWFACQLKTEGVPAGNLPMILTAMKTMNAMIHTYKAASASLDCVSAFGLYDDAPARSCGKTFIHARRDARTTFSWMYNFRPLCNIQKNAMKWRYIYHCAFPHYHCTNIYITETLLHGSWHVADK